MAQQVAANRIPEYLGGLHIVLVLQVAGDAVAVRDGRSHIVLDREISADLIARAHTIANEPGKLGVLFKLLRQAAALAQKRGDVLEVKHLQTAYERRKGRFTWQE